MSRINMTNRNQGHRVDGVQGQDIDQRLTYQQLLNLNHDYAKENALLKNIAKKLGDELHALHTQFQKRPREENTELYGAISEHPHLQTYEQTLIPLLDAYEYKIQEFQHDFQILHEEYFGLEKKFQEACRENEKLNIKLTDARKQLMDLYKNGNSEAMHSDFGQIILEQVNERQKVLVQQNSKLERDYQRYKSQAERNKNQLQSNKEKLEQARGRIKDFEISQRQLQFEINSLKDSSFELQVKANEIEAEKRKLQQAHERAQSQNNTLNKQKEMYKTKLEQFRYKMEKQNQVPIDNDHKKFIEQLQTKIAFLEAQKGPSDTHKKMTKLQRQFQALTKEKNRLKDALDSSKIREDELNEAIIEHRSKISSLEAEKTAFQLNENKIKRSLQTLSEKSKNQLVRLKKSSAEELQKLEFDLKHKIDLKDKKINELQDNLQKITLQKQKIERQMQINGKNDQKKSTKDSERALAKMKEKLNINEQLFKEQIQIFQNDLSFLKKQNDSLKAQNKEKTDQLKKLKVDHENLLKKYEDVSKQKAALLQQFRKVRDQYEIHLKDKETVFQQKIRQIKSVVQDSDNRRRAQRERVQEASREYKRVLQDIKSAYQARIRELQSQSSTQTRFRAETYTATPGH